MNPKPKHTLHQKPKVRGLPILSGFGILLILQTAALVRSAPLNRETLNESIERHRKATVVIKAGSSQDIRVRQLRHAFWFGAALSNSAFSGHMGAMDRDRYLRLFGDYFNAAVTENALKWHVMEPRKGEVNYQVVDRMLDWTDEIGIPLRGHNIFWGISNRVPAWQKEMDDSTLTAVVRARARDIGKRYRGRFAEYDLNNEMIHGNYYEERLGAGITKKMAEWVRSEDPGAVLYLNDYDILTGNKLVEFTRQISQFEDQSVGFDGIGVQGHLHGDSFNGDTLQKSLDVLSQFKMPIRVTEFNFPGQRSRHYGSRTYDLTDEEETIKAQAIADYYRICFAHPAVEGILMWGFWEGANWIPVSSLFRRDWTPTPAAKAYHDLIKKEWWTDSQIRTNEKGECQMRVFFGKHRIEAGSTAFDFEILPGENEKVILIRSQ